MKITYKIAKKFEKTEHFYVQHIESGDFDYTHCPSYEAALAETMAEVTDYSPCEPEDWIEEEDGEWLEHVDTLSDNEINDLAEEEFGKHLNQYTPTEVLDFAGKDHDFPLALGFVEETVEL
jgi:hypothetical protein